MIMTGKDLMSKGSFGHIHTYGSMYSLEGMTINKVQNPYDKETVLHLTKEGDFGDNLHNHCKPIPNTGFWFSPFDFEKNTGDWLNHVTGGNVETDEEKENLQAVLNDSLYEITFSDKVKVLYLNSKTDIKNLFRQPDNTYYIDWELLAESFDVVYFTNIASKHLNDLGYSGFEFPQGVVLKGCDYELTLVNLSYDEVINTHPRGLFQLGTLQQTHGELKSLHELFNATASLDRGTLVFLVNDFQSLSEVFDHRDSSYHFRGQEMVYCYGDFFRKVLESNKDFTHKGHFLTKQDVEFKKYRVKQVSN